MAQPSTMIGASLFSSAGIAETYLANTGVHISVANELIEERANLYQALNPDAKMISGNILDDSVFKQIVINSPKKLDFLIASPPCQGMSVAGKNRNVNQMMSDERNYLVFKIIEFVRLKSPDYVIIENVPTFFKVLLPFQGETRNVMDILNLVFSDEYQIEGNVYDAAEYGVAQRRNRAIIRMYRKGTTWGQPEKSEPLNVVDKIGHLPSIEAGEKSDIKWHFSRKHSTDHIRWMRHTPTGKSAFENDIHFPAKKNGNRIKSYNTTYRRIKWDEPAPTITMRNDAISSQLNVHPGRHLGNGLYSDARVLSPLELMMLTSLPENWRIPENKSELLIRRCIGESIPPLLICRIVEQIQN